ncbi:MAG: transposase [Bryobacterales bacterium]|nr:transposase [Bryobacterales bacterium]
MWRFTRTNGITEGLRNKVESISGLANGCRNFHNHRQRVQVLCS